MSEPIVNHQFVENAETVWDEAAEVHKPYRYEKLLEGFMQPGYNSMPSVRRNILKQHGVVGKSVFQPCCNNGRDILSVKNLGASRCFGFDISSEFIKQGNDFAKAGNIDCELIQADVFKLDSSRDGAFDICLISLGTMMWMPDLKEFFMVMKRLLNQNGWMLIHEFHPLSEILKYHPEQNHMAINGHYFENEPQLLTGGLDYFGGKQYNATPCYRFRHKMSDVIEAIVQTGFSIETFKEYEEDMSSDAFKKAQPKSFPFPRSYSITANI